MTRDIDRRTFLGRIAIASLGFAGASATATAQDDSDSARLTRRIAFRKSGRLDEAYVGKILLLTDRKSADADPSDVAGCAFSEWPTDRMSRWEGIVVDWKNAGRSVGLYRGGPTVEATQLIERNELYLDEKTGSIELGTPFVIESVVDCPGEFVGVTASRVPGVEIRTGPGESTRG